MLGLFEGVPAPEGRHTQMHRSGSTRADREDLAREDRGQVLEGGGDREGELRRVSVAPSHQAIEEAIAPGEEGVPKGQEQLEVLVLKAAVLARLAGEAADLLEQGRILDALAIVEDLPH